MARKIKRKEVCGKHGLTLEVKKTKDGKKNYTHKRWCVVCKKNLNKGEYLIKYR